MHRTPMSQRKSPASLAAVVLHALNYVRSAFSLSLCAVVLRMHG